MPPVDVTVETLIRRPVDVVATYACDPDNATAWYVNITSAQWQTPKPLALGSRLEFTAAFLGRSLTYTYEVVDFVPGRRFVMRTAQGPFPMETVYEWTPEDGGTRMVLRNHGQPSGFSRLAAPMLASAMRRATRRDLARLKSILESDTGTPGGGGGI